MFLIANPIGALMLLVTFVIMVIGLLVFKIGGPNVTYLGCVSLLLIDLSYRFFRKQSDKWFYENASGGNLFFFPAWAFGLILLVVNIIRFKIR